MRKFAASLYDSISHDGKVILIEPLLERKKKLFVITLNCAFPFHSLKNLKKYKNKYENVDDVLKDLEQQFHNKDNFVQNPSEGVFVCNYDIFETPINIFMWKIFHKIYREISGKDFLEKNFHIRFEYYNNDLKIFCDNVEEVAHIIKTVNKVHEHMTLVTDEVHKLIDSFRREYGIKFFFLNDFVRKFNLAVRRVYLPLHPTYLTEDGFQIIYSKGNHGKYIIMKKNGRFKKLPYADKNTFKNVMGGKIVRKVANMPLPTFNNEYYRKNKKILENLLINCA